MLVLGLIISAGGTLLLARTPDHGTDFANVLPGFLALEIGLGLSFVAVSIMAMADVDSDHAGLASGLLTTGMKALRSASPRFRQSRVQ